MPHLSEYTPTPFAIDTVELDFDLDMHKTTVRSTLGITPREGQPHGPLVLDGEDIEFVSASVDGRVLEPGEYEVSATGFTLKSPPQQAFTLLIENTNSPINNTQLQGLYASGGRFTTQCESQGFRRITYFYDRPDVLSKYTVRMEADKGEYPTLLSNGDRTEYGAAADGRHFAVWHDPWPKPAYLFALVAGAFETIEDSFTTMTGKAVGLFFHVDHGDGHRASFALDALKRSMRWDEDVFGREYDLDQFHVVGVRDFNYGAMENKGLNIFNSSTLLADSASETDADFTHVERVVAHEYFHNWTGNRITLRDWFQLCLKEGLTVFRDQQFSGDQNSRTVQRIKDVSTLRAVQFPEDAGALAHPPRPDAFERIENFYTPTVYNKGAEVVRVLKALLGDEGFYAGMDEFFNAHDGQAVTVEAFVACFERATGQDLTQFMGWYTQAGTPEVTVECDYDAATQSVSLKVSQDKPVAKAGGVAPLPIPLRIGFIARNGGQALSAALDGGDGGAQAEHTVVLTEKEQSFTFTGLGDTPVPAVLRGFQAPVILKDGLSVDDRLVQMAHDPDAFTRWDAGQSLLKGLVLETSSNGGEVPQYLSGVIDALAGELQRADDDPALASYALSTPSLSELLLETKDVDPEALHTARETIQLAVAEALEDKLVDIMNDPAGHSGDRSGEARGRRALRNVAMGLLSTLGDKHGDALMAAFTGAETMTATMGALRALTRADTPHLADALAQFEAKWRDNDLVMDKWFAIQAANGQGDVFARIDALVAHPAFTLGNPNRIRSVYSAFSHANVRAFHDGQGRGYDLVADAIATVDKVNEMIAGRLVRSFENVSLVEAGRRAKARASLSRVRAMDGLSEMQAETIGKLLESIAE